MFLVKLRRFGRILGMGYDSKFSQLELFLLFKRSLISFALYTLAIQ
jgi:hypothetical protein